MSVVMSIVLLVPDWRQQVGRWDRFHYIRVGVIVAAFVLLVVAGVA